MQTCFEIEDFGSNRTGIALGNAGRHLVLKVLRDCILDGLLAQNVAYIQIVNAFFGEFDIQQWAVPFSVGSPTLTALISLFEEISKIIPEIDGREIQREQNARSRWTRTRHIAVSMAVGTILYEYDGDLTVNSRTTRAHRTIHRVSHAYYISLSHDVDDSCWFCQTCSKHLPTGIVSPTYINPQRLQSMPYSKLADLQDRLSKLCVLKERLVKLLENELSVMRILHVL